MYYVLIVSLLWLLTVDTLQAQQVPDPNFKPVINSPAYELGKGPRVGIDEAHHNFHTATGRYQTFADLLRRDGYQVAGFNKAFTSETLKSIDVLVIANALNEKNKSDWSLPTPSAFTPEEIAAVHEWVKQGGSLFLIADHMPFPGAASDLAKAFGIEFSNGYARPGHRKPNTTDTFDTETGLRESVITRGRNEKETVSKIATFGGSAFKMPAGGVHVIVFEKDSISHETTKAPGITPDAPKVNIEGWSQGAVLPFGQGRVAVFGEAAMFSAQLQGPQKNPMGMNAPEAKQNPQLLLNVMHWLTRVKGMEDK